MALLVFWFILGAIFGSFLNVVIWRLPRQESLGGRSKCPHCGHVLSWWELFPVLSFALLRGKCRSCRNNISSRYFIIETVTGLLFALAWWQIMPQVALGYLQLIRDLLIISVFIVVFVVDLEHLIILDNVIMPGAVSVLLLNIATDLLAKKGWFDWSSNFWAGLAGALFAFLPLFCVWYFSKGRWMGFGDVKLAVFLGIALGWPLVYINLLAAVFLGGIAGVYLIATRLKTLKSQIPFGTFLSLGGVLALFWGQNILRWYLSILGF